MPTYEFQCTQCGHKFEIRASMEEKQKGLKPACPTCESKEVIPALSAVSIGASKKNGSSGCCGGSGCCS